MAEKIQRMRAWWKVFVAGQEMTNRFDPHVISVRIEDKDGGAIDVAEIELRDDHGKLRMPNVDEEIRIALGWTQEHMMTTFEGKIEDVTSFFQRRSGRRISIECKGADLSGDGKTPVQKEWGEGSGPDGNAKKTSLSTVMNDAAKDAGYQMHVSDELGKIERTYWAMTGESFHNFGHRIAKEVGGIFKVSGQNAAIVPATENKNAKGETMPEIEAAWGKNLIAWRLRPFAGRPDYKSAKTQWFDVWKGAWENESKDFGGSKGFGATSSFLSAMPASGQTEATNNAGGEAATGTSKRAGGWILVHGEPQAKAGGTVKVVGARPQIDGTWRIKEVEHDYRRGGGYITRLEVEQQYESSGDDRPKEF